MKMTVYFFASSPVYHCYSLCVCLCVFLEIHSQIDDKEFDIPQVDTPPTLESILNEVKLDNDAV